MLVFNAPYPGSAGYTGPFKTRTVYRNAIADRIDAGGGVYYLDFEVPGEGQPKAVIFSVIYNDTFASTVNNAFAQFGYGATDGVSQWAVGFGKALVTVAGRTDSCVFTQRSTVGGSSIYHRCAFDSWKANGVRLRSHAVDGDGMIVATLIYGDSSVGVKCGIYQGPVGATPRVLALGFRPAAMFAAGMRSTANSFDGVASYPLQGTIGLASIKPDDTIDMGQLQFRWETPGGAFTTTGRVHSSFGYLDTLGSPTSTGISVTAAGDRSAYYTGYLAIGGIQAKAGIATIPTGTGSKDLVLPGTAPAWTPEAAFAVPTRIPVSSGSTDTAYGKAMKFGFSHIASNDRISQLVAFSHQADGEGQNWTVSNFHDALRIITQSGGTTAWGEYTSLIPNGLRLNMTTGAPEALQMPMLLMAP